MNDLEICKRIAEIEGVKFTVTGNEVAADAFQVHELFSCAHMGFIFNPLTDDALCFKLMVKHDVDLTHDFSGLWCASMNPTYAYDESVEDYGVISYDKSPNFAILLAIIEAHKV
jgi:hypothetical protein